MADILQTLPTANYCNENHNHDLKMEFLFHFGGLHLIVFYTCFLQKLLDSHPLKSP